MRMRDYFEQAYNCYNTSEFIRSDPIEIVREYDSVEEREVVAMVTSCLSYGRIASIKESAREILNRLGNHPGAFLRTNDISAITGACEGFRHRFTGSEKMSNLLVGIRKLLDRHGSLESCFCQHRDETESTLVPALSGFVEELSGSSVGIPHLLPSPQRGSACKRLWLFLRWMVRDDAVDPGGWDRVDSSRLVVPLDAHMGRICRACGMTTRSQADLKAALEATQSFRNICPDDPVRYDFALTRVAMFEGMEAIEEWRERVD